MPSAAGKKKNRARAGGRRRADRGPRPRTEIPSSSSQLAPGTTRTSARLRSASSLDCFFFHDPAANEIYTLSLHDALPIWVIELMIASTRLSCFSSTLSACFCIPAKRSEEHTSELQSRVDLVCRLLLE